MSKGPTRVRSSSIASLGATGSPRVVLGSQWPQDMALHGSKLTVSYPNYSSTALTQFTNNKGEYTLGQQSE